MSRSKWKGPFVEKVLLTSDWKSNKNSKISTLSRKSTILPFLIDKQINIHNGREYVNLKITKEMLGHRLGEFIPTRIKFLFKRIKK